MAEVNNKVCREFNIKRSVTSAYHPQTNGLDERTNQTLKVCLSKLVNDQQNDWGQYLEQVAFSIRTQKQCSTKHTLFFLMFGRNLRSPLEVLLLLLLLLQPTVSLGGVLLCCSGGCFCYYYQNSLCTIE